jgi:hypothetical protein
VSFQGQGSIDGEPFSYRIDAEPGEQRPWVLRAALWQAVAVLEANGPWVRLARSLVMTDAPGDCLYMTPAWLLDFDAANRREARRWRLMRGRLTNRETGKPFDHAWLEVEGADVVVSVSNLRNGYPAYAVRRERYYTRNGLQEPTAGVTTRRLRVAALKRGLGPALARWLHEQLAEREVAA